MTAEPVFRVGRDVYDLADVVAAAIVRGDWTALELQVRQGLACQERARRHRLPVADLETAAQEFRRSRNLITAAEAEAWLAASGLSFEDWSGYLERLVLRRTWAFEIDTVASTFAVDETELHGCLLAEAICSGELQRHAEALAGRAGLLADAPAGSSRGGHRSSGALVEEVRRACRGLWGARDRTTAEEWSARVLRLVRLDDAFQATSSSIPTDVLQSAVEAHAIDWVRVLWRALVLPDESTAREAALCFRHEREPLEAIAARAGAALREEALFLDAVDPALRPLALSARAGELIGPSPAGGGFRIALVLGRATPSLTDEAVRARAEEAVRWRMIEDGVSRARWLRRF